MNTSIMHFKGKKRNEGLFLIYFNGGNLKKFAFFVYLYHFFARKFHRTYCDLKRAPSNDQVISTEKIKTYRISRFCLRLLAPKLIPPEFLPLKNPFDSPKYASNTSKGST